MYAEQCPGYSLATIYGYQTIPQVTSGIGYGLAATQVVTEGLKQLVHRSLFSIYCGSNYFHG